MVVGPLGRRLPPAAEAALSGRLSFAPLFDVLRGAAPRELDHPIPDKARYYPTGDVAYEDIEGYFHHLGRIDNQVKILGRRVEIEEIESHLRALSGGEAIAVAWPRSEGAPIGVVAFVCG